MARVEVLSGRERRRFWSDAQKLAILDEISASGQSASVIARRHDVSPQQVYGWRRQFRDEVEGLQSPALVPVTIVETEELEERPVGAAPRKPNRAVRSGRIEIRCCNGRVLSVEAGIDARDLKALVRSVEDA